MSVDLRGVADLSKVETKPSLHALGLHLGDSAKTKLSCDSLIMLIALIFDQHFKTR